MTAPEKVKRCKDCEAEWLAAGNTGPRPGRPRAATFPGPRCASHNRLKKRADRLRAAQHRVERVYGLTPEQYDALYEAQGGRCAGCRRATGKTKRLAVDHDHALARLHDHPEDQGCPACTRGLLCSICNDVVAHFRDDPVLLIGLANYLIEPPAVRVIRLTTSVA